MSAWSSRSPVALIAAGVLAIVFGITACAAPALTALSLVVVWGVYALADGIANLVLAFRPASRGSRTLLVLTGVLGVLAGVAVLISPGAGGLALSWILGVWLIVRAVVEIAAAFGPQPARERWILVLGGLLWLAGGVLVLLNPGAALVTAGFWLGLLAVAWGVVLLVGGVSARRRQRRRPTTAPAAVA